MLLTNQKGNSTLFGITLIILFTFITLNIIHHKLKLFSNLQQKQQILICTKEVNGMTQALVKKIRETNHWLKILTLSKHITMAVPYLGLSGKISTKAGIKLLKKAQMLAVISHLKKMKDLDLKSCSFNWSIYKTPITILGLHIKRSQFNEAIFREEKWKYYVYSQSEITINSISNSGQVSSRISKRVKPLWKLF